MLAPVARDPLSSQVLDELVFPKVLANRANRDTIPAMEVRILDEHVGRVRLGRDLVVALGHIPASQRDVVRVERVDAIRVLRTVLRGLEIHLPSVHIMTDAMR